MKLSLPYITNTNVVSCYLLWWCINYIKSLCILWPCKHQNIESVLYWKLTMFKFGLNWIQSSLHKVYVWTGSRNKSVKNKKFKTKYDLSPWCITWTEVKALKSHHLLLYFAFKYMFWLKQCFGWNNTKLKNHLTFFYSYHFFLHTFLFLP